MKLRRGPIPTIGLLLLSALSALGWVLADLLTHSGGKSIPWPRGEAILFTIFGVMTFVMAAARRLQFPRGRCAWACAGMGVGLFVVPAIPVVLAQQWTSRYDEVAALCLTPVFAVILEPYLQDGPPRGGKAGLAGAMVAIAGILLLFPLETPHSVQADLAVLVLVATAFELAAATCVAVRLARSVAERSFLPMAAQAGGASALCFAALAVFSPAGMWDASPVEIYVARFCLLDIPGLLLLFWLMTRLAASRLTARLLLTPLFAALAGLALVQTRPSVRDLAGILLLAGGSAWLVFAPAESVEDRPISVTATPMK